MSKLEGLSLKKDEPLVEVLDVLYDKIASMFSKDASGHSIDHLKRTLSYALQLQEIEGGDRVVVGVAAFIHDIHRILGSEVGRFVSPKESLPVVEKLLEGTKLTQEQKQHILYAVEHHEEYNFGNEKVSVSDIESKILQDADNLDAIGAIGIIRTIKYGQAHKVIEYDPNVPFYQNDFSESKEDVSTIHHIHNKLLRLGENMNTETARKFAKVKTDLMKNFLDMYVEEYNGRLK